MKLASSAMLSALVFAGGCAATTPPDIGVAIAPADPSIGITDPHYHPVVGGYVHREPVDPKNWRRLNQELSPAQGGDS